jgi:2-succinyl-5-enolpyruvyl-6-hydroxy-3-cyclohexene-1-carboxylate synthase
MYDAIIEGSARLPNGVSFEDLASSFVQDGSQPSTADELNTAMQECVTLMGVNVSESTKRRSLVSDADMPGQITVS